MGTRGGYWLARLHFWRVVVLEGGDFGRIICYKGLQWPPKAASSHNSSFAFIDFMLFQSVGRDSPGIKHLSWSCHSSCKFSLPLGIVIPDGLLNETSWFARAPWGAWNLARNHNFSRSPKVYSWFFRRFTYIYIFLHTYFSLLSSKIWFWWTSWKILETTPGESPPVNAHPLGMGKNHHGTRLDGNFD